MQDETYKVHAFVSDRETISWENVSPTTFLVIYQSAPAFARYAVMSHKGRILIADLYESEVISYPPPFVHPKFVGENFVDIDHALAWIRITY